MVDKGELPFWPRSTLHNAQWFETNNFVLNYIEYTPQAVEEQVMMSQSTKPAYVRILLWWYGKRYYHRKIESLSTF